MSVNTLRPGVFSSYTAQSSYSPKGESRGIALAGCFGEPYNTPTVYTARPYSPPTSPAELAEGARVIFGAGIASFVCVSMPEAPTAAQMQAALAALGERDLYYLVCDGAVAGLPAAAGQWAQTRSADRRETVAICGLPYEGACALAAGINNERVTLVCGGARTEGSAETSGLTAACGMAALLAGAGDPSASFSGAELPGLAACDSLNSSQVEELLAAGVTPLEQAGDAVCCVRALTTRTKTEGIADRTFAPVNTILIIDYVMTALREGLTLLLRGAKNNAQTLSAISTQITVLLESMKDDGIITAYGAPQVYCAEGEAERCIAEVAFTAAYIINQIHITAHISL